jgi:hypothetical protein
VAGGEGEEMGDTSSSNEYNVWLWPCGSAGAARGEGGGRMKGHKGKHVAAAEAGEVSGTRDVSTLRHRGGEFVHIMRHVRSIYLVVHHTPLLDHGAHAQELAVYQDVICTTRQATHGWS